MAKIITKASSYEGGIESSLNGTGRFLIFVGIIGLIASFIYSGYATKASEFDDWGEKGLSILWISIGLGILLQGIVLNVFLSAQAEIIRLLKRQNGLNYGRSITEPVLTDRTFACSECDKSIEAGATKCPQCGVVFDEPTSSAEAGF